MVQAVGHTDVLGVIYFCSQKSTINVGVITQQLNAMYFQNCLYQFELETSIRFGHWAEQQSNMVKCYSELNALKLP